MPHRFACSQIAVAILVWLLPLVGGCSAPLFRGQSPETKEIVDIVDEKDGGPNFVADLAAPVGTTDLKVESVALVTQLEGTGSDPPPSMLRDALIRDMQAHTVRRPEEALSSKNTAMVIVTGYIRPGAQKGDKFDISVRIAERTETSSLRNGWLMPTRLREHALMDNSVHEGHVAALVDGPILCDALFDKSKDSVLQVRGRVLGRAVVQLEHPLALVIRDEHTSIKTSTMIGAAINERFFDFDRGTKRGLANPTRDNYVELRVHSRYRDNLPRFIQVVRSIAVGESPIERLARIQDLEKQLFEPTTSQRAALRLEAIGKEGISTLQKGLASSDPEIRFYSAEALAYLDDGDATEVLYEAARTERAFRWRAMLGLAVMDQFAPQEALVELMNSPSAETRYGAFRALRALNDRDPMVRGEILNDEFAYHVLSSTGEPMIHISRSSRPEIVVFGQGQKLKGFNFVFAGKIIAKSHNDHSIKVTRFMVNGAGDESEICSNDLGEFVRTIAKLGGTYADIVEAIQEAKSKGYLAARLEIDALPRPGRVYVREESSTDKPSEIEAPESIPDIFLDRLKRETDKPEKSSAPDEITPDVPVIEKRSFLDRMTSWMVVE